MPESDKSESSPSRRLCDGLPAFRSIRNCLPVCLNCRKDVEGSLSRVSGRRLRSLRDMPSCAIDKCVEFVKSVGDDDIRFHLAAIAWWRFSSEYEQCDANPLRDIMAARGFSSPTFGTDYMHRVIRELSRVTGEQMAVWFGCETLYDIADLFSGGHEEQEGPHCRKCVLYRLGCKSYASRAADTCTHWKDGFLKDVAAAIRRGGRWNNQIRGV